MLRFTVVEWHSTTVAWISVNYCKQFMFKLKKIRGNHVSMTIFYMPWTLVLMKHFLSNNFWSTLYANFHLKSCSECFLKIKIKFSFNRIISIILKWSETIYRTCHICTPTNRIWLYLWLHVQIVYSHVDIVNIAIV